MLETNRGRELAFTLGTILYGALIFIFSFELYPKSRMMPLLVLGILALLVTLKLLTLKSKKIMRLVDPLSYIDEPCEQSAPGVTRRLITCMLWLIAIIPMCYLFGFILGLALWLLGFLITASKIRPLQAILITVVTFAALYVFFTLVIHVRFMPGILTNW